MATKSKFFSLISLGCSKNLVDSEKYFYIFKQAGYTYTAKYEIAETILINTCGFINDAKEEAILTILDIAKLKKGNLKKLIVTGCLVKRYKNDLEFEIPEVDIWLDLKDFHSLKFYIANLTNNCNNMPAYNRELMTPKHYAYLRISDGCDNRCSYCVIPDIRGSHVSETIDNLILEAQYLANLGVKELIINAQDTTRYGYDLYGKSILVHLLKKIEQMNLFPWIRVLYLHPAHLTEEMIEEFAGMKTLLPYFDIPLQHINDEILRSMNRKIDKKTILKKLYLLRDKFPECAIRTTFITGFPGETRAHFNELERFIKDFRFTRLGVFTYSDEEGTVSNSLPQKVLTQTAQRRKDKLMALQQSISSETMAYYIGKTLDVLIDKISTDREYSFEGRSFLDAPEIDGKVLINKYSKNRDQILSYHIGDIIKIKITDSLDYDLIGEV